MDERAVGQDVGRVSITCYFLKPALQEHGVGTVLITYIEIAINSLYRQPIRTVFGHINGKVARNDGRFQSLRDINTRACATQGDVLGDVYGNEVAGGKGDDVAGSGSGMGLTQSRRAVESGDGAVVAQRGQKRTLGMDVKGEAEQGCQHGKE